MCSATEQSCFKYMDILHRFYKQIYLIHSTGTRTSSAKLLEIGALPQRKGQRRTIK